MQRYQGYLFLLFVFFATACGHTQLVLEEVDADISQEPPRCLLRLGVPCPANANEPLAPSQAVPPQPGDSCNGFAVAVTEFNPGGNSGFGQESFPDIVLGPPKGLGKLNGSVDVLSLGIEGEIILDVGDCHIVDQPGADFIVFENPFFIGGISTNPFKELGIVGVSLDGEEFVEFDCLNATYPYTGCAGWHPVYSHSNNNINPFDVTTAGGDPFDLADIGLEEVKYIRIRETNGAMDPVKYGFDLDAIAVIHGEQQ